METVHQEVVTALNDFGLSEVEISVYKALLLTGARPASIVAQKAGLKRGHTYNVLQSLMDKGIVQEYIRNSVKHFTCSPPDSLLSMIRERERKLAEQKQRMEQLIPKLEKIQNPLASHPRVRFFQGLEGIKLVYEDMIQVPDRNLYGVTDIAYSWTFTRGEAKEWLNNFIHRRAEQNIWWLGIMNKSEATLHALETRPWLKRRVKLVEGLELPIEIHIYDAKVAITSTHGEMIAVVIENQYIADTFRNIHQAIWEFLPEYEPKGHRVNGTSAN